MLKELLFVAISPFSSSGAAHVVGGILGLIMLAVMIAGGIIVYFIPTIAAFINKHPQKVPIFLLNFFAGWTLLGWVGGLVWAFVRPQSTVQVVHHYIAPPAAQPPDPS